MEPGHSASSFSPRGKGLGFVPAFRPRLDVIVVVGLLLLGLISLGRGMPF